MTYCFDLDGTLCTNTYGNYEKAIPFTERIAFVNKLYDEGNHIIINTARGSKTKIDWNELTIGQLSEWGLKYNEIYIGKKIDADIFIDDKAVSDKQFFKNKGIE
jgi:hypothetical protein